MIHNSGIMNYSNYSLIHELVNLDIDHIWKKFFTVPSNGQEFFHIPGRCWEQATKIFSKYGLYIYIKLLEI